MSHPYSLLAIVFAMGFVFVFDKVHWRNKLARLSALTLLSQDECDRLMRIWSACQDA